MPPKRVYFDKTEIVCAFLAGKRYRTINLSIDDIQRIQISPVYERSLFKKVSSEQISIMTGKVPTPIVYKKGANRPYWDEYVRKFTEFAERNLITFSDDTQPSE